MRIGGVLIRNLPGISVRLGVFSNESTSPPVAEPQQLFAILNERVSDESCRSGFFNRRLFVGALPVNPARIRNEVLDHACD